MREVPAVTATLVAWGRSAPDCALGHRGDAVVRDHPDDYDGAQSFGQAVTVAAPFDGGTNPFVAPHGVACTSTRTCETAWTYFGRSDHPQPMATAGDVNSWSVLRAIDPLTLPIATGSSVDPITIL